MTDIEPMRRHGTKPAGFRIVILQFRGLDPGIFCGTSSLVQQMNIAELQIFNVVAANAGDDRGLARCTVGCDDIANDYSAQLAYGSAFRTTHTSAQTEEKRHIDDVPHRNVSDGNVFQQCAIDGFESDPAAIFDHTIRNSDVAESAVALGSEFYPAITRHFRV